MALTQIVYCLDDFITGHRSTPGNAPAFDPIPNDLWLRPDHLELKIRLDPAIDLYRIYPNQVLQDLNGEIEAE